MSTYWEIGKFIFEYLLENESRAGYGDNLFVRLSQDVGINVSSLERSVLFFKVYPISAPGPELSWTHYRSLMRIENDVQREKITQLAIKNEWSSKELAQYILELNEQETPPKEIQTITQLSASRGKLFIYKIVAADFLHPRSRSMVIDCGFDTLRIYPMKGIEKPKASMIIESKKSKDGYRFKKSDAHEDDLYTFVAFVEKVIDGDTLHAHIDCGFDVWSHQSLRFRGVDAPEIKTKKGKKAKAFVEDIMKSVSFVVVKIYDKDKYGRFLADVYYSKKEEDPEKVAANGTLLNQQLLDVGLAVYLDDS